jgi:hypothetical protein
MKGARLRRVFRKPIGQHAARRPRAYDDEVVMIRGHGSPKIASVHTALRTMTWSLARLAPRPLLRDALVAHRPDVVADTIEISSSNLVRPAAAHARERDERAAPHALCFPHSTQARIDVDRIARRHLFLCRHCSDWPRASLKIIENVIRDKSRARGVHVPVAIALL